MIVGAMNADRGTLADTGVAYVFERNAAGVWVQQQKLVPSDQPPTAQDGFGRAVAIDGDTIVVGAFFSGQLVGIPQSGAVYVYTRTAGVWSQQQKLVASDAAIADNFGTAVAVSGNTLIATSPSDDHGSVSSSGSAYVFTRSGTVWTQQQKISDPANTANEFFGSSGLALDGDIAVIAGDRNQLVGAVYVFERIGAGPFAQSAKIQGAQSNAGFGGALALEGTRLAIGAQRDDDRAIDGGALFVYERSADGSWTQLAKLLASDGSADDRLGSAVSLRGDTLAAGAPLDAVNGTGSGSAYVFSRSVDGSWNEEAKLLPTVGGVNYTFGSTLAIAGESLLVGERGPTRCLIPTQPCPLPPGSVYEFVVAPPADETPPVLTVPGALTAEAQGPSGAAVSFSTSALDDVDGALAPSCVPASGSVFALGVTLVRCTATDAAGNAASADFTVTVADTVAPVIASIVTTLVPVPVGTAVTASAQYSEAVGAQSGTWSWGDGATSTATIANAAGGGQASGAHSYATPGVYTVTLELNDASGNSAGSSFEYVVVFDPVGGFVTGAGGIDSPAGAYAPDPAMTGRAQLGFQAKYAHGASAPTGNTQFRIRVADFDFESTRYDWLVIAGARARYKGTGTLNGVSGYSFMVTATDGSLPGGGGSDRFRIKIWSAAEGVVYDNQRGAADDAPASQAITHGNIVIHAN
jgi:hypothetical protein